MKRHLKILIPVTISILLLSSCGDWFFNCYQGNGVLGIEDRAVTSFDQIVSSGEFDIRIDGDTSAQYLRIEGDENLLDRVVTKVRSGVLYIELEDGNCIEPEVGMTIYIGSNTLNAIDLDGKGNLYIDDLSVSSLELNVSGDGNIYASGKVNNLEINIDGVANIIADEFRSNYCSIDINGEAYVYIYVNTSLVVDIDGVGTVYYTGNISDENVSKDIDGTGSVTRK